MKGDLKLFRISGRGKKFRFFHVSFNLETAINHRERRGNIFIAKEELTVFDDFLCALFYAVVKLIISKKYKKRTQRIN